MMMHCGGDTMTIGMGMVWLLIVAVLILGWRLSSIAFARLISLAG